jgi:hypothetical protein
VELRAGDAAGAVEEMRRARVKVTRSRDIIEAIGDS